MAARQKRLDTTACARTSRHRSPRREGDFKSPAYAIPPLAREKALRTMVKPIRPSYQGQTRGRAYTRRLERASRRGHVRACGGGQGCNIIVTRRKKRPCVDWDAAVARIKHAFRLPATSQPVECAAYGPLFDAARNRDGQLRPSGTGETAAPRRATRPHAAHFGRPRRARVVPHLRGAPGRRGARWVLFAPVPCGGAGLRRGSAG